MKKLKLLSYILFSTMLIGCGGGGGDTPLNVAPEATNKTITLNENQNKQVVLDATDADGNSLTYKIVKAPSHGIFKDGVYTPTAGYVGSDSFTYVANDGTVDSQQATVTITVTADFDGDDISDATDTDDDNDGVADAEDAFPLNSSESVDTDGDGTGNNADADDDGDGVADAEDAFPLNSSESVDTDGDGTGNNADTDDDGDGIADAQDAFPLNSAESIDTDGDGIGNNADTDDDNDGISDDIEISYEYNPLIPNQLDNSVIISGKIEYERINPLHNGNSSRLDSNNITVESAKEVIVKVVDSSGTVITTTSTNNNGEYILTNLPKDSDVKIRVYAKMFQENKWDIKVIDNINSDAQYVIEGDLTTTGTDNSTRNLKATASTKTSPPFAILDSVYIAMKKVLSADSEAKFPSLDMKWSVNNVESGTYYDGNRTIMLQGDQSGDSDEYDDHIIVHEWGHYFESKFSRADSIGGQHGAGDILDIRLAFGEGWGNAWSAIATDDPLYYDTFNNSGWNMNIESGTQDNPGWFSEASIQRILYDLYDSNDDGSDSLSLGFKPLYDVLVGTQKVTPAFTSIFSFIKALKDENIDEQGAIDSIVSSENIATIEDIYGTGRTNRTSDYPYYDLNVGSSINMEISAISNSSLVNKLANRQYIKFVIPNDGTYTIKIEQIGGTDSDPDYYLYKVSPFKMISFSEESSSGSTGITKILSAGNYLLDVAIWGNLNTVEYKVSITQ